MVGAFKDFIESMSPLHFGRTIVPMLKQADMSDDAIDGLLVDNPRNFFLGEPVSATKRLSQVAE